MSETECTHQPELLEVGRQQVTMSFDGGQIVSDAGLLSIAQLGFEEKYWSVHRSIKSPGVSSELPFRRIEVDPGWELQVDFAKARPCADHTGSACKTPVFRAVLSYSRKGYTEAVTRLTTESFTRSLENAFWRLGGVPKTVVFDNAKCAALKADWYEPRCIPRSSTSASTTASRFPRRGRPQSHR